MNFIDRFVRAYKETIGHPKKVKIFLTPIDLDVKIKVQLKEDEFDEFMQEFADFNSFWYNNISESCLFSVIENSKLEYKTVFDNKFDIEKAKHYGKILKDYFESKNYYVIVIDLTFLNWFFK